MKKKIAALAAAVMIVSALPDLAADVPDESNAPYCYNQTDGQGHCGNGHNQGGHHGGCWRN